MALPLLAASDWGIAVAIGVVMLLFVVVGWVIVQGTRAQLAWRTLVEAGDIDAIRTLVAEELDRWKSMRMPKGTEASVWHGVQTAELVDVQPDGVRLSASAEGQYALVSGERREVSGALREGMKLTSKLADMTLYDIPNVKLDHVHVDIYTTYRNEAGSSQRCVLSTLAARSVADGVDWDATDAEDIVRAFGGRYVLDDRGQPLPINPDDVGASGVPAAFYEDD